MKLGTINEMGKVSFYTMWSLRDAPRQLTSEPNRLCYRAQVPLPLPEQLVVFSLGDWRSYSSDTVIMVDVLVGPDVKCQHLGTLSSQRRCLVWEGDWRSDLLSAAVERAELGLFGKIVLTPAVVCQVKAGFTSSTPVSSRKRTRSDWQSGTQQVETFPGQLCGGGKQLVRTPDHPGWEKSRSHSTSSVELSGTYNLTRDYTPHKKPRLMPVEKCTALEKRRFLILSSGDLGRSHNSTRDLGKNCGLLSGLKTRTRNMGRAVRPRPRWCHAMCLSDPETAVMIGGEATEQTHCTDSLWKLEIDDDFWFPMDCSSSGPIPLCSRGHSATYDPESKTVYVYGGMKDGRRYSDIYILNTLTWKWSHVAARGLVPTLAYHTATIYKKELLVFGGVCPSRTPEGKACSNALFIFNPEYELWYQPIVEGDKPQPRFGHSATLLMNKLLIFGGKKTPTYLNDLCIMDLGYMEYSAVKYANTPPLPRGFHAAVPVSDKKMLISGGCSAIGALQDIFFFNLESSSWSELLCPALCAKPRAGHSMINLVCPRLTDTDKQKQADTSVCTILIFGGSDCTGTFYNDTVRSTVETGEGRTKRL